MTETDTDSNERKQNYIYIHMDFNQTFYSFCIFFFLNKIVYEMGAQNHSQ